MTIEDAKQLRAGDGVIHNGVWAARIGREERYEVVTTDAKHIRVRNPRGYVSLYNWQGCSTFVTSDFFTSCRKEDE